jgi:hypothetical protein
VKAADLNADELAAWSAVSALDDAKLAELTK